ELLLNLVEGFAANGEVAVALRQAGSLRGRHDRQREHASENPGSGHGTPLRQRLGEQQRSRNGNLRRSGTERRIPPFMVDFRPRRREKPAVESATHPIRTWTWRLAHGRSLELGPRSVIMGVLNVTPDSFSDGGRFFAPDDAIRQAKRMIDEGAAIIDVGGESTRPGASSIGAAEEQQRVLPIIEALASQADALISIDTYRAETARLAVGAGAHIVNAVWGLQRDPAIAGVAAEMGTGLVIMHTGRERERLADPIADQKQFLAASLAIAERAG